MSYRATKTTDELPAALFEFLAQGQAGVLLTTGKDGYPNSAFTWLVATGNRTLQFVADIGSATLDNLVRESQAAIQILGAGNLTFLIKGKTRVVKPDLGSDTIRLAQVELAVESVKDQSWAGVTVAPLSFEWPEAQRQAMQKFEKAIILEMRSTAAR
ncbi:MAG: pyridoxamine 5'-phosphate oxidase family protein [Gammaproteobacteria bacterium]